MLRMFVVLAMAAGFAAPALAQGVVLVPRAPAYKDGERFAGALIGAGGERMPLAQSYAGLKTGRYLFQSVIGKDGKPVVTIETNIDTLTGRVVSFDGMTKVTRSTCRAASYYPLVLDKEYVCTQVVEHDGKTSEDRPNEV